MRGGACHSDASVAARVSSATGGHQPLGRFPLPVGPNGWSYPVTSSSSGGGPKVRGCGWGACGEGGGGNPDGVAGGAWGGEAWGAGGVWA